MKKNALINRIAGQGGSYLAEFLLDKNFEVHGIKCRAALFNTQRVERIYEDPHVSKARFKLYCTRRGENFFTRKITRGLANMAQGLEHCLYLCKMDALGDPAKANNQAVLGAQDHRTRDVYQNGGRRPESRAAPSFAQAPWARSGGGEGAVI
jgi:GDP-D-mannose dehydratase